MHSASIPELGGVAGRVGDEPWGATLASIAKRRMTGQLQLRGDDARLYRVAFVDGVVVAAHSPLAADSIVRIALTSHLVSASAIAAIQKRVAMSPNRDEVDLVVDHARMTMEQAIKLRRRAILQRAARTFSVDRGEYRFEREITLPAVAGIDVDVRAVLALGIRMNLSESRLSSDLKKLGLRFELIPTAELAPYDFGPELAPIVDELRDGATLHEIDARHRDIEPRFVQSMVYALVAGGACEVIEKAPATPTARAETASLRKPATIEDIGSRTRTTDWQRQRTAVGGLPENADLRPPAPRTVTPRNRLGSTPSEAVSKPPPVLADEAFQRGVMALRRDDLQEAVLELVRACELAPMDVDYAAMLAWAKFCAAADKQSIAAETKRVLEAAIKKSPKPMMARFYLGRVERILGRVREALIHFKQVIELEPGHADAAAEIRMLEPRIASERRR